MKASGILTLLTDFGWQDAYVADPALGLKERSATFHRRDFRTHGQMEIARVEGSAAQVLSLQGRRLGTSLVDGACLS
jgi:S-adenosylmethionine hydrolase